MTTIACNKDVMAADSQATASNRSSKVVKIFRVNGDIIGCSGTVEDWLIFVEWYKNKTSPPELDSDFGALVLTRDGTIYEYGNKLMKMEIFEDFYAIGSGSDIAIGAMSVGADPKQAVKIAAKFDVYTGEPVKTFKR